MSKQLFCMEEKGNHEKPILLIENEVNYENRQHKYHNENAIASK